MPIGYSTEKLTHITCARCSVEYPKTSKFFRTNTKSGNFCSPCKPCMASTKKAWRLSNLEKATAIRKARRFINKAESLQVLAGLKAKPCTDCGQSFESVCMDFDHVKADKSYNITDMVMSGRTIQSILLEASKCELICANCHRTRTLVRNQVKPYKRRKLCKSRERILTYILDKKKAPCLDCNHCFPREAMDFDHLDPSTKVERLGVLRNSTFEVVVAEIAKCELVCANCHRKRTKARAATITKV